MNNVVAIMYESVKAVLKLAVRDQQIVTARRNCNLYSLFEKYFVLGLLQEERELITSY